MLTQSGRRLRRRPRRHHHRPVFQAVARPHQLCMLRHHQQQQWLRHRNREGLCLGEGHLLVEQLLLQAHGAERLCLGEGRLLVEQWRGADARRLGTTPAVRTLLTANSMGLKKQNLMKPRMNLMTMLIVVRGKKRRRHTSGVWSMPRVGAACVAR